MVDGEDKIFPLPELADLREAARRIAGHAVRTPLRRSEGLSRSYGTDVYLKLETAQHTGAFKLRGATNAFLALTAASRARGVITYSTGNHGLALAHVARTHGTRCVVCLSDLVPEAKRSRLEALGAFLDVGGDSQDAAMGRAQDRASRESLSLIDPIDDRHVIAGQGTIALEIIEDLPDVATVVIPLSGGGLFGGIAVGMRALRPQARLVAVSTLACPAMVRSLEAGRPITIVEKPSLADSLGGGIGLSNRYSFRLARYGMDANVLLTELEIADAMRLAFRQERLVLEGAAAAGIAALRNLAGSKGPVVVVVTGDNVDIDQFRSVLSGDLPAVTAV